MNEHRVTSTDIKIALAEMHKKRPSYFITECKTCSTYFPDPQGLLKFDGLAITKSYTKPCITGYEIKVSRGDFKQDSKWHLYLQYCNEFFFVVPTGLVKKEELPENVGLIYYNPETKALRTVKKAMYRKIEKPIGVYEYIIFSRLDEDRLPFYESRAEYARDYLMDKAEKRYLGREFGQQLVRDLADANRRLSELERAENELTKWKMVEKVLEKHYLLPWSRKPDENYTKDLEEALDSSCNNRKLKSAIDNLERGLNMLKSAVEENEDENV